MQFIDRQTAIKKLVFDFQDLIVNYTAIKEAGYSPGSLYCCYRVVQRVEQSPDNYDMDADNVIKYAPKIYNACNKDIYIQCYNF